MAIKELKKHNATTSSTPPPKRAVNTHDTDTHQDHPPMDTPTGDPTPPYSTADPDLDNTEPCEDFTFDDSTLEHIMDTYSPSYSINKTHIYHVSKHSSSDYGSLIDRGANGGLAGSDVKSLERTGRTVSVTGIGNHDLPGLDIVTCAALLHTNHGNVVLIMHEYAYYGRGNTIQSPGQIEWFQNTCDDKSFHTIPSLIPLASPTLLNTNMLSKLNPLILRSSGPILARSTNTPLRRPSTKPLNGLLLPLGIP